MGKLVLKGSEHKALSQRLQGWSYPKLVLAFLAMTGVTGLDLAILDFIPFVDEAFLAYITATVGWAIVWKTINRTPTTW